MDLQKLRFTKDHEWVRFEGNLAYLGITDYAQKSLGDIVFVELPEEGAEMESGDVAATVESVKTVSDVYTPLKGKVVKVNSGLEDDPARLNGDPYGSWITALETESAVADGTMSAEEYEEYCKEGK